VNGGANFESDLLEQIYAAIKEDEIVMPAEHTGLLRDNYLWKLLIRRGAVGGADSQYVHAPAGSYNHEIFGIVWAQTVSALSFVYDRSVEVGVVERSIGGFRKCAQVAAFYMMSDVFDNIVISLCKFTALSNQMDVSQPGSRSDILGQPSFRHATRLFLKVKIISDISRNYEFI